MDRWYVECYHFGGWIRLDYGNTEREAINLFHEHRRKLPAGTAVRIHKEQYKMKAKELV